MRRRWRSCSARCRGCGRTPGWCGVRVIAVDGTKVHANASQHATQRLRADRARDPRTRGRRRRRGGQALGEARGDELPEQIATREGRQRWLRDAHRRLDERRAQEARPIPGPRPKRLKEGKRRLEEDHQVQLDATPPVRTTAASGGCATGAAWARTARPSPTSRTSGRRAGSTSPIWTRATSRRRAAGCRATTRRPSRPPIRSSSPPNGATCIVDESLDMARGEVARLHIKVHDPADIFDADQLRAAYDSGTVRRSCRPRWPSAGAPRRRERRPDRRALHPRRHDTPAGCVLRSRFWLGDRVPAPPRSSTSRSLSSSASI
jgi:hypothetical protein